MKYNYFFVKRIKAGRYLWYREELEAIFKEFGLTELFEAKIMGDKGKRYRWFPTEVFRALET